MFNVTYYGTGNEAVWYPEMGALVMEPSVEQTAPAVQVTVHNLSPTLTTIPADIVLLPETSLLTAFSAEATDPGIDDVLSYY